MSEALVRITICVIARDEADNLRELLPTLRWADELMVLVDDRTRDDSAARARPLADRVEERAFTSFPAFRNLALDVAREPWVFFVDADERVSADLAAEARAAVSTSESSRARGDAGGPIGYWVPRHNIIVGRLIRGGGWAPDYQLRLMHRHSARYDESRAVHETVVLDGPAGYLDQRLLHLNYGSWRDFVSRQRGYTALEAQALRAAGVTFTRRALVGQPLREFARRYLQLGGWKDGPVGHLLSLMMAYFARERVRLTGWR